MSKKKPKSNGCYACGRGFPEECTRGGKCITNPVAAVIEGEPQSLATAYKERIHGGAAAKLKDPKSTGRKRAAKLYPLDSASPCEWRGKKNCGGGRRPIVGCVDGKQTHRHHGPVKDTTRNHEGNVHRICVECHNHWHELNDLIYNASEYALLPHDPMDASPEELVNNLMAWKSGEIGRKFVLASSKNMLDNKMN